jgi:hypothetical protein
MEQIEPVLVVSVISAVKITFLRRSAIKISPKCFSDFFEIRFAHRVHLLH